VLTYRRRAPLPRRLRNSESVDPTDIVEGTGIKSRSYKMAWNIEKAIDDTSFYLYTQVGACSRSFSIRQPREIVPYGRRQWRILYFFDGKTIVLTQAFLKKTATVPREEIKRAVKRMADWNRRGGK